MAAEEQQAAGSPGNVISELAEQLELRVREGEWQDVEKLTIRLRRAILQVPTARRRDAIHEAQRITEIVFAEAEIAHRDVAGRLSGLRRGQLATRAYRSG